MINTATARQAMHYLLERRKARESEDFEMITDFLNSTMVDTSLYIDWYNHFASACGHPLLDSEEDIFTDKNNQTSLVIYILLDNGDNYYGGLLHMVFDE